MPARKRLSEIIPEDVILRPVDPHIYSLYPSDESFSAYDRPFGYFYEWVACNRFYNRLVWGYSVDDYHSLCIEALHSSTDGWVLDAGCGSLAFTAHAYAGYAERPVVLLDQSMEMIRSARSRLVKLNGEVPEHVVFLHGDALRLIFNPRIFNTIISFNMLHVLPDAKKALRELKKLLAINGTMTFTTLIETGRLADRYLKMWENAGEVTCRNIDQLQEIFDMVDIPIQHRIRGNLAFIHHG